ncbi:sigma-54-dependent transcriptional regulator [Trinickia dinghuensis]|uniref:Sigma-54-dependent Fis family transcriptional regulator n=1 Tax=Trinickia dinghuensis TaxID=2291023 RepID=A0A3D8JY65_9BURK|nr:sigma-54 dependent transcriptional regulator [Trinickia dinghuensis]RDU98093.1 sigma-54-dependent Fis family transcriptional regulator [Trinickia dinghuensis]
MEDEIRVLVVEDDENVRVGVEQAVALAGYPVAAYESASEALSQVAPGAPLVVVSDLKMPGMDGMQLLAGVLEIDPQIPVVLISGHADISTAVGAMQVGAYDFIEKPFSSDHIAGRVARAVEKRRLTLEVQGLRAALDNWQGIEALVLGKSPAMAEVRKKILRLAGTSVSVLITGETGTGKELIARSLHDFGGRRDRHFVALNCGGLPEQIFESELFGHEAGAFTGAIKKRVGKVEWADGGTLFLDEIETMPVSLQIKMLRVLQERVVERLGANEPIPVDCRVVAASKADLAELSADGRFRADLLYRLNVAQIELPPLRERREDVPLLFEHFVLAAARKFEQPAPIVSASQVSELMTHQWPGNVRELQNVADRFVLGLTGDTLLGASGGGSGAGGKTGTLAQQLAYFERMLIEDMLRRHNGSVADASVELGMPKKTLYHKLRQLKIVARDAQSEGGETTGNE